MSYYANSVQVNPEGDVHISDETRQGLGTTPSSKPSSSLLRIFAPPARTRTRPPPSEDPPPPAPPPIPSIPPPAPVLAQQLPQDGQAPASAQELGAAELMSGSNDESWRLWTWLMALMPVSLGYFVAGAFAGMISRTTTAPLDR